MDNSSLPRQVSEAVLPEDLHHLDYQEHRLLQEVLIWPAVVHLEGELPRKPQLGLVAAVVDLEQHLNKVVVVHRLVVLKALEVECLVNLKPVLVNLSSNNSNSLRSLALSSSSLLRQ